jgi:hypothetical protein
LNIGEKIRIMIEKPKQGDKKWFLNFLY